MVCYVAIVARLQSSSDVRLQPVLVSNCDKHFNSDLWRPETFSRDYGHLDNDLVNCNSGVVMVGHKMNVFWDGFEHLDGELTASVKMY